MLYVRYADCTLDLLCLVQLADYAGVPEVNLVDSVALLHSAHNTHTSYTAAHYIAALPAEPLEAERWGPVSQLVIARENLLLESEDNCRRLAALRCKWLSFDIGARPSMGLAAAHVFNLRKMTQRQSLLEYNRKGFVGYGSDNFPLTTDMYQCYFGSVLFESDRRVLWAMLRRKLPRELAKVVFNMTIEAERRELLVRPWHWILPTSAGGAKMSVEKVVERALTKFIGL